MKSEAGGMDPDREGCYKKLIRAGCVDIEVIISHNKLFVYKRMAAVSGTMPSMSRDLRVEGNIWRELEAQWTTCEMRFAC